MASKALQLILHPDEAMAMVRFKIASSMKTGIARAPSSLPDPNLDDDAFCFAVLTRVSRSFAGVICELNEELRLPICVFYLVLRGLDTVEDDMSFPQAPKLELLRSFHTADVLYNRDWRLEGVGDTKDYMHLMKHFYKVVRSFLSLKERYQVVIADITRRMGHGMADFIESEVDSEEDWDLYCHYVAGLVGLGLSGLVQQSSVEQMDDYTFNQLSNHMGLFLQKVNIIRDYLEDIEDARIFWPKAVWSKYTPALEDFKKPAMKKKALHCLNDLICNGLNHATYSLEYLSKLRDPFYYRFCSIPQVMAIATLDKIFNNHKVFTKRGVKIRKGIALRIFNSSNSYPETCRWFHFYARSMLAKVPKDDPNADLLRQRIAKVIDMTKEHVPAGGSGISVTDLVYLGVAVTTIRRIVVRSTSGRLRPGDWWSFLLAISSLSYLLDRARNDGFRPRLG